MRIIKIIENEVNEFLDGQVKISEGYYFSQWDLVKRIMIYANGHYPEGKLDSQENYKYWFDIISSRKDNEVKNVDFDTSDVNVYTNPPRVEDSTPLFLINATLNRWLRDTGQAVRINDAIEDGSLWGNIIWKKTKKGYDQLSLENTYIINQTARTLDETPVVERHEMTQSDLREKRGVWKNVDNVIENYGKKSFSAKKGSEGGEEKKTENPYYEVYERNGEVAEDVLFEAMGKSGGDEGKYVLAKIVVTGLKEQGKGKGKDKKEEGKILYANTISKMPYKEYHRGRYQGRWMRKGICELLFDYQTRYNEIGNQIARGMEYSMKVLLNSAEKLAAKNALTDLMNGDIIEGDVKQIVMRIPGMQEAINEWNRLVTDADKLCNSFEIVQGETMPSGMPFRLGALLNLNANKLFVFLREKLGLALESVIEEWILPDLIKNLKTKEIIEIAGDSDFMAHYYRLIAQSWYLKNLIAIGPHTKDQADALIESKIKEIQKRPQSLIKYQKDIFNGVKAKARVVITGESLKLGETLETYSTLIRLETDPVRRTALIEKVMILKGIDVAGLPKSTPEQLTGRVVTQEREPVTQST